MPQDKEIQNINIKELSSAVSQICDEKGLDRKMVFEVVSEALAAAYKKEYGKKGQIIKANFDSERQTASFYQIKEVVDSSTRLFLEEKETEEKEEEEEKEWDKENSLPRFNPEKDILLKDAKKIDPKITIGGELNIALPPQNQFGRIAAQNAKQVILQRLREAERSNLYEEFKDKEGEVISATVQRLENNNVFLDLGKMVGILFPGEQVFRDNYNPGQRIKVYVDRVSKDFKDTTVILSRSNPKLVSRLFQLEVPEIFAGTVTIETIAREAGIRTKIAVRSREEGIDPIGSCIGQGGIRVETVISELNGEKIDIIEFNDDPKMFITRALSPAKIKYVEIYENEKRAVAVVKKDQLSLAIGSHGQNVRLASKLTGWRIDVISKEGEPQKEEKTTDTAKANLSKAEALKEPIKKKKKQINKTTKTKTKNVKKDQIAK